MCDDDLQAAINKGDRLNRNPRCLPKTQRKKYIIHMHILSANPHFLIRNILLQRIELRIW